MRTSELYDVPIHYLKSYTFTFAHGHGLLLSNVLVNVYKYLKNVSTV